MEPASETRLAARGALDDAQVADALQRVPLGLREYFTPGVAVAVALHDAGFDLRLAFKTAAAAGRYRCRCCLLRNKPRCCTGRSQLERAAFHGCAFCTRWLLLGYGSVRSVARAQAVASTEEVQKLLAALNLEEQPQTNIVRGVGRMSTAIPRVVHQIWIGPRPPPDEWIDTWRVQHRGQHPAWTHWLWRDEDVADIMSPALYRIYRRLPHWCFKADILRYAVLQRHGGLYIDADIAWLGRLGLDVVTAGHEVVLSFEREPGDGFGTDERIANSVIGVPPEHPLIARVLDGIVDGFAALEGFLGHESPFLDEYKVGYRLTSPPAITRAFMHLGMDPGELVAAQIFYPLPWWGSQSLSVSLEQTCADFPLAVTTHYGYSTNRL